MTPKRNDDGPITARECAAYQTRVYGWIYTVAGSLVAGAVIACSVLWTRANAQEDRLRAQELHGVQVQSDVKYIREAVDEIRVEQKRGR